MPGWFRFRQTEYALPGLLLAVLIALLVLPPIWFLVQGSVYTTNADFSRGEMTLRYYHRLVREPALFTSSLNSTVFAVGSSVVALLFGAMRTCMACSPTWRCASRGRAGSSHT